MTTTKDIAAHLNLAVSTVGRALADDPRISEATKSRVREAADEFGYVANRAPRMLRGVRSTAIGLVVPDIRNSFYSAAAHALTVAMASHDHQVMLCETGDDRQTELSQIRDLAAAQVAGVVIVPTPNPDPAVLRLLQSMPCVQFNRRVLALGAPWFGIDDDRTIHLATEHLLGLGHRRIAYIGGTGAATTGGARLAGFRNAVTAAGLPAEAGMVDLGPPSRVSHGGDAFRRLMSADDPPTAIVTGAVQVTVGVLAAAHADRVAVPEAVSIVGFGDDPAFAWWGPGLTTIALPVHEIATACGTWLLEHLEVSTHAPAPSECFAAATPGTLVLRGSTASRP